eukprot:2940834-Amphidinium_carterae.1
MSPCCPRKASGSVDKFVFDDTTLYPSRRFYSLSLGCSLHGLPWTCMCCTGWDERMLALSRERENVGIGKRWNRFPGPRSTPKQTKLDKC